MKENTNRYKSQQEKQVIVKTARLEKIDRKVKFMEKKVQEYKEKLLDLKISDQ